MDHENIKIESKGICLLCLDNTVASHSRENARDKIGDETNTEKQTMFDLLMRYLKINVFTLSNFTSSFVEVQDSMENVKVIASTCNKCSAVVNELGKLYQDSEMIRLKMDKCVHTLCGFMESGDKSFTRVQEYKRRMSSRNPYNLMQASLTENLRNETLNKCQLKMKSATPKVALKSVEQTHLIKKRPLQTAKRSCKFKSPKISSVVSLQPSHSSSANGHLDKTAKRNSSPVYQSQLIDSITEQSNILTSTSSNYKPIQIKHENSSTFSNVFTSETIAVESYNMEESDEEEVELEIDLQESSVAQIRVASLADPLRFEAHRRINGAHSKSSYSNSANYPSASSASDSSNNQCFTCGKMFETEDAHQAHASQCHDLKCAICGRMFSQINSIRRHIRTFHSRERPFSCDYCGYNCGEKSNLTKHLLRTHTFQVYANKLPPGATEEELNTVIRMAVQNCKSFPESSYPFGCFYCSKQVATQAELKYHVIQHHFQELVKSLKNLASTNE